MDTKLQNIATNHQERLQFGEKLAKSGDARKGVGLNPDGSPDIDWCSVSGGTLEFEGQSISIQNFQIAKYPITYVQYNAFIEASDGYGNDLWWHNFPVDYQKQALVAQEHKFSNHPRERLSWYQAIAFSRWFDAQDESTHIRLPYEWEWQWAAQGGTRQLEFAFGAWQENHANTDEANLNRPIAVGMYPHATTACGALDMTGNIWEWCMNDYENIHSIGYNNGAKKVRRGGSYNFPKSFALNSNRDIVKPETRSSFNGMRLMRIL